jgi:hypothetical protein
MPALFCWSLVRKSAQLFSGKIMVNQKLNEKPGARWRLNVLHRDSEKTCLKNPSDRDALPVEPPRSPDCISRAFETSDIADIRQSAGAGASVTLAERESVNPH